MKPITASASDPDRRAIVEFLLTANRGMAVRRSFAHQAAPAGFEPPADVPTGVELELKGRGLVARVHGNVSRQFMADLELFIAREFKRAHARHGVDRFLIDVQRAHFTMAHDDWLALSGRVACSLAIRGPGAMLLPSSQRHVFDAAQEYSDRHADAGKIRLVFVSEGDAWKWLRKPC